MPADRSSMDEAAVRVQSLVAEIARLRRELEELRLRDPDALLQALMDQAPDQIYFKDLNSRFIRASRAVAESFRMGDPGQLKGMSDFDFFSEEHANRAFGDEQDIIRSGRPKVDLEEQETWPDGSVTWVSTTKMPLRALDGTLLGTFGISRDITARKRAEEALRISEEKLRMVFDHGVDGFLLGSPEGVILEANRAACTMTGRARAELVGLHISAIFTPESQVRSPFRFDLLKAGQKVVSERDVVRSDGSTLPTEMHTKMMPDGSYQAILRDISERREAEAALRESEASYRGLFDSVLEDIYIQDRDGRFLDVNRGTERTYGHPREYFLGRGPEDLAAPGRNDLAQVARQLRLAFEGEPQRFEFWGIRASGEVFPKEVRLALAQYFGQQVVIALAHDISERKSAEKAIQDSERHYRELMERLQEGFAMADTEERFVAANPAAAAIFGVTDGLAGHALGEFVAPEAMADMARRTEERRQGVLGHYELPIRRPDGSERILSLSVSPWLSEDGTYLGSSGLFQDITEQKQAEQALRESERNFRELLEKLGEGFGFVDPEERWLFANPAAEAIFGVPRGSLAGRSIREFVDAEAFQLILRQTALRRQGIASSYEFQITRPDGQRRYVSLNASPYIAEDGTFLGSDTLFMDITERRQAETALKEVEARYRDLFRNTTDAIFWIKVEPGGVFRVESINPAEEERLGAPSAEIVGKTFQEILPEPFAERIVASYRKCVAAGVPTRYEETVDLAPGRRTFLTLLVPIRDEAGVITRLLGFSQDVTQSKQAEEALRQAQKLESLGVLAGGIAHDFNNLLTAILGNLNLAQIKSAPESPAQPYLENVERTVLKAAELTKQMLAYSGKGRFVVKPHDLNQVVQEMTHLLNVSISKKVVLRYDLARELPWVEADAAQIQQVVMNLVTNASEAIGESEGVIAVTTRTEDLEPEATRGFFPGQEVAAGRYVVLEISDSGCGIPPQIMSRIFDPFFTTKQSGRGLGLSAMLGILRGHRAGIRIRSRPGQGTTFTLYFPVHLGQDVPAPQARTSTSGQRFTGRVLLADDEEDVRESTSAMLEVLGFEVVVTEDGQDAVACFGGEAFDLVLLDLTMPRMDGREAFRELRNLRPDIPVVLYSGYTQHASIREILAQPSTAFLHKPFQLADLREAVRQVLHR